MGVLIGIVSFIGNLFFNIMRAYCCNKQADLYPKLWEIFVSTAFSSISTFLAKSSNMLSTWSIVVVFFVLLFFLLLFMFRLLHLKLSSLGVLKVFPNRDEAYKDIFKDLVDSNEILLLGYKGNALLSNSDYPSRLEILEEYSRGQKIAIKALLLSPQAKQYVKKRSVELGEKNLHRNHSRDIEDSIVNFRKVKENGILDVECRLFSEALKWSLLFSDKYILVSFYNNKVRVKLSPCFKLRRSSMLGWAFEKHFRDLWEKKSIDAFTSYTRPCVIVVVGGSFTGKSIISNHLSNKYQFSGVLSTDMVRNFFRISTRDRKTYQTSTYRMDDSELNIQKNNVSNMIEQMLEIYRSRREKIIIEGMHLTEDFLRNINKQDCLIIGLDNKRDINDRLDLKMKTTREEVSKKTEDEKKRINEIHYGIIECCKRNNFKVVEFQDIEDAKDKCEHLVEEFFTQRSKR